MVYEVLPSGQVIVRTWRTVSGELWGEIIEPGQTSQEGRIIILESPNPAEVGTIHGGKITETTPDLVAAQQRAASEEAGRREAAYQQSLSVQQRAELQRSIIESAKNPMLEYSGGGVFTGQASQRISFGAAPPSVYGYESVTYASPSRGLIEVDALTGGVKSSVPGVTFKAAAPLKGRELAQYRSEAALAESYRLAGEVSEGARKRYALESVQTGYLDLSSFSRLPKGELALQLYFTGVPSREELGVMQGQSMAAYGEYRARRAEAESLRFGAPIISQYYRTERKLQPYAERFISPLPEYERPTTEMFEKAFAGAPPTYAGRTLKDLSAVGYAGAKAGQYIYDFEKGYRAGLREQPLKAGAMLAVGFIIPGVLSGVGAVGSALGAGKVAAMFPGTVKVVSTAVKIALPTIYGYSVYSNVMASPPGERSFAFGKIAGTEIVPLTVGGVAGAKFWPRVSDYFRTFGRQEIPAERMVAPEVLSGKARFPTAPAGQHLGLFKSEDFVPVELKGKGFPHAAPESFVGKEAVIAKGSSELPGLYVSGKGVSVHFLKLSGQNYGLYGGKIFSPYGTPEVMYVKPLGVRALGAVKTPQGWEWSGPVERGFAYVPGMKPEVEAIISPGTVIRASPSDYFLSFAGRRIPIGEYYAVAEGAGGGIGTLGRVSSRYYLPASYPVLTPGSVGIAAISESVSKVSMVKAAPSRFISSVEAVRQSQAAVSKSVIFSKPKPVSSFVSLPEVKSVSLSRALSVQKGSSVPSIESMIDFRPSPSVRISPVSRVPFRSLSGSPGLPSSVVYEVDRPIEFVPLPKGGFEDFIKSRKYPAKVQRGYMPSFQAFFARRTGKYSKGELALSGLEFRPVTSKFAVVIRNMKLPRVVA